LHTHPGRQIGIFAISFLAPAPSGVAKDIDVRTKHCESLVLAALALSNEIVIFCASFSRNRIRDIEHQIGVPGGRETDALRKNSSNSCSRYTVQTFIPPVIRRNAQTRNRRSRVHHL